MEITITTTKKKLSKSLVNQMRVATASAVKDGDVLGYMVNVVKDDYKSVLIKYMDQYYTCTLLWRKQTLSVSRPVGKWTRSMRFDSEAELNEFWTDYQQLKRDVFRQIYI